jgi:hypothetical protein
MLRPYNQKGATPMTEMTDLYHFTPYLPPTKKLFSLCPIKVSLPGYALAR